MSDFRGGTSGYKTPYRGGSFGASRGSNKKDSVDNSIELPNGYNVDNIRLKNGDFNIKYVLDIAKNVAQSISNSNMGSGKIRSYYDTLIKTIDELRSKQITVNQATLKIAKMISIVNDRYTKKTASMAFVDFITMNVNRIVQAPQEKCLEYMMDFKHHYEAVIGFMDKK